MYLCWYTKSTLKCTKKINTHQKMEIYKKIRWYKVFFLFSDAYAAINLSDYVNKLSL